MDPAMNRPRGWAWRRVSYFHVAGLISTLALVRYVYLVTSQHASIVCFIPDDAFYELQLARHFLARHVWSFDGTSTTTTGFHLLNVYLMSLFPGLFDNPWVAIKVWMGAGLLLSIASIFTICRLVEKVYGRFALVIGALVLSAPAFSLMSTGVLEFPYVVAIGALYVATLFESNSCSSRRLSLLFLLGFFGSLARSDFGGLPFAVFAVCLVDYLSTRRTRLLVHSFAGLAGATAGLAVVLIHNYLFSGHYLSGSAMAKALWAEKLGYAPGPSTLIALETLSVSGAALCVIALTLVMALVMRLIHRPPEVAREDRIVNEAIERRGLLARAGLLAIVLYILVYGADGALQVWYTANFVIPVIVVIATFSSWAIQKQARSLFAAVLIAFVMVPNVRASYRPCWPNQRYVLEMSDYLRGHPVSGPIAGWNVGIAGYFLDGGIVNLDGLMNDQIYPYMRDDRSEQYIDNTGIKYLIDYPFQLDDWRLAKMCGYQREHMAAGLKPIYRIVSRNRKGPWLDYTLFERRAPLEKAVAQNDSAQSSFRQIPAASPHSR